MNCKICRSTTKEAFKTKILGKHDVTYFFCDNCGFLQTQEPFWLAESYKDPINLSDTGYVTRNVYLSKKTLVLFSVLFGRKHVFLDYAGGYGMLARLMRDYGLDFKWLDPHTPNIFANGFEYAGGKIEAMTCFECFEHFVSPLDEIGKLLAISNNIFFSTRLLPDSTPPPADWDYYGFEHGQHVSLYSEKTLEYLARKYKLNYFTDGKNFHFFTKKKINNFIFKSIMFLSRLQLDLLLRKIFSSKIREDADYLAGIANAKK